MVVVVGWSFMASGLIALQRSVEPRLGLLMTATGFALIVGPLLQYAPWSLVFTLGVWLANAWVVLFVWFLVLFRAGDSGRAETPAPGAFLVALGPLMLLWFLFWDPGEAPGNAFLVVARRGVADFVDWVQRIVIAGGALLLTGVLARRWFRASASLRRSLTPILVGGAATVLASVTVILDAIRGRSTELLDWILLVTLVAVPLAVLADMLRARLAQSAVGELVLELSGDPAPRDLHGALARALHDPSLRLAYWLPEYETYADPSGHPVEVGGEPAEQPRSSSAAGSRWRHSCTTPRCRTSLRFWTRSSQRRASRSRTGVSSPSCARGWRS